MNYNNEVLKLQKYTLGNGNVLIASKQIIPEHIAWYGTSWVAGHI